MIAPDDLYQPNKYKVILGEGKTIGFCTLWNEPEKAIKDCPDLLKRSAIIGTLYSRQGVNILLRNLALNPQIRKLVVWNNGALSCSPFGISGKEVLFKLWKNGLSPEREVKGTDFKIEKEIDPKIVELIVKNVSLEEIKDSDLKKIADNLKESTESPYMKPARFIDAIPEVLDIFPSEKVGFLVRGKTVLDAWTRVVDRIMRYGTVKGTQYGTQQRELIGVTWVIENEDPDNPNMDRDWPTSLKQTIGLNNDSIDHYRSVFLSPETPEGVKYTYGNRLMRYPGPNGPVDQIKEIIIKELKDSIDTRRGTSTTMVPWVDKDSKEPPCLTQIQVLQTNKKLHLLTTFRSHDIFKAAIPNAFGLRALQKKITEEVGMEIGSLQITSQSAHIYEAEWEDARKLVQCAIWDRPAVSFYTESGADPRGMFIISIRDKNIIAEFKSPKGNELVTITAKSAAQGLRKIAQLELINRPEHLMDIGAELQKAEIAISLGIPYTQDKTLPLKSRIKKQK